MSENEILDKVNYMINNWHRPVVEIKIDWIKGLLDLYQKEKEKNKKYKKSLLYMVNQFAYDEKAVKQEDELLYTGGLSALEEAFDVLDIEEETPRRKLWNMIQELLEGVK